LLLFLFVLANAVAMAMRSQFAPPLLRQSANMAFAISAALAGFLRAPLAFICSAVQGIVVPTRRAANVERRETHSPPAFGDS